MDVMGATGLGIRSKLRFGVSYSIWECDPETNDHCKLSRHSDGSGKCYGNVGDSIFNNYGNATKKALLVAGGKNDFTYPCSAANVMTPKVVGGKITPMYWYEDARDEADDEKIEEITALGLKHFDNGNTFTHVYTFSWILWFALGTSLLFRCLCFAPPREFLKQGAVSGVNGAMAGSTASSVASTTED